MTSHKKIYITRAVRRSIMIALIALFFVVSPMILLYTAGYRYDFAEKKIKETGVISVDVEPRDTSVFLNEVRIKKRMPIRLANRAPGTYHLALKRDGYYTWEKDISVVSKQTTYIKDIVLIKKSDISLFDDIYEHEPIALFPSHDGQYLGVIFSLNDAYEIVVIETKTKHADVVSRIESSAVPSISWSSEGNRFLLVTQKEKNYTSQYIDRESNGWQVLFTFTQDKPINYQWQSTPGSGLFIAQSGGIYLFGNGTNEMIAALEHAQTPWYVDAKNNLWVFDTSDNAIRNTHNTSTVFHIKDQVTQFISINDNRIIAKTEANTYLIIRINNTPIQHESIRAHESVYNPSTKQWVVWSPWEYWVVNEDGNVQIIDRNSQHIDDILPLDEYGVILIHTKSGLQTFHPNFLISHNLLSNGVIEKIGVNKKLRMIYILTMINKKRNIFELSY